jgi:putative PIN family toxin of toxin-antitoxin system
MQKRQLRIVIDTNLWISFLLSPASHKILWLLHDKELVVLLSEELYQEITTVASREKFRKFISGSDIELFQTYLLQRAYFVTIHSRVIFLEDPKDAFLFSLCKDGRANYLITGDKTLLDFNEFEQTKIVSLTSFLNSRV